MMERVGHMTALLDREPQQNGGDGNVFGGGEAATSQVSSPRPVPTQKTSKIAQAIGQGDSASTAQQPDQTSAASSAADAAPTSASSGTHSAAPSAPSVLVFDMEQIFNGESRVFQPNGEQNFEWTRQNDSVTILDVVWLAKAELDDDFKTLGTIQVGDTKDNKLFGATDNTTTKLEVQAFAESDDSLHTWDGSYMMIKVDWETEFATGYTQSSYFSVSSSPGFVEVKIQRAKDEDSTAESGSELIEYTSGASESSATTTSSATETSSSKDGDSTSSSNDSSGGGGGGGGGGLATGAIAGIAVGAAVILILLGGLTWFLLRRRRSKQSSQYDNQPASSAFMTEKDTHHAVDSPYSDDGHGHGHGHGLGQQSVISSTAQQREAFMPHHTDAMDSRPDVAGGAQTPQGGVSRSVAHLVEDGMTEEEIRRLEAEERQLDDEIERAGRR